MSIWTHNIKGIEFQQYDSQDYKGPSIKVGAGVLGKEAYAAADKEKMVIVGGECATVGPAGGYTQGGGHSALSSKFGLAADQTLEWEVIDGQGRFLKASRIENPELYWALSGGGAGTYGVVYSMTVKIRPDFPVTGLVMNFTSDGISQDTFFEAIDYFNQVLPTWTSAGAMAIALISNSSFDLTPVTLPNITANETNAMIKPFVDKMDELGIDFHMNITTFPSYLQHYQTLIEPNPTQLVQNGQYGGRLIPRSVVEEDNANLTAAIRRITDDGISFVEIGLNVSSAVVGNPYNAVLPAWRDAAFDVIMTS